MQLRVSILFTSLFLYGSLARICKPDHFWRPFKGEIPQDAFIAGKDGKGKPTYVVKIVPLDQYLWTTPAQLYSGENVVNFNWISQPPMKIDKFIHILCIDKNHTLEWILVNNYLGEVVNNCCLVEAGIGKFTDSPYVYIAYVGRKIYQGASYIGRIYENRGWSGVHVMYGDNSTKFETDFDVLTYDCDKPNLNLINYRIGNN